MSKQSIEYMIEKCSDRIEILRNTIAYYETMPVLASSLKFYYTRWETTLAIKQRLENYKNSL